MYQEKEEVHDIETLIRKYGNDVLRTAYMYVKDSHLAEDIFQDVFIKVNQKLHTFQGDSNIKTWIIRITINTCKDYMKSAWNQKVMQFTEVHENTLTGKDEFVAVEQEDENRLVRDAVIQLPQKYKDVLLCVYFQDMSVAETAKLLGIAEGTAKSRLSRAKDKLKLSLEGRI
ncbi:MAG: polymerase, sigma-24 subunit, subfamily [Anaerocolumna sp.]|jgi:RNA polymerase sigma-70 factor (ECF subfamily)|nr:polymerase, sigma-24 subunit, subfamily [Anaerocolumna sp.]